MATKDKASNKIQDIRGKVEETVGKATGNEDLENQGKTDQVESAMKGVGEKAKDAVESVKHAVTDD
jgi:uncharacterized protein YjbJ (UPF0337 family)